MGDLPKGWSRTRLSTLGRLFRGRGGTRADEEVNGLPCVRYGDLYTHHDFIIRSFASAISPSSADAYTRLQYGDIVFAGSGETFEEIGKGAAYCGHDQAFAGGDTIVLRPGPRLDPRFTGYAVNSEPANRHKSRMGQGSSVIHISSEHLGAMPFILPPRPQQQRIADVLVTVDEAIQHTEALIAKTQHIKAGLMCDLFTHGMTADGKLRPPREKAPELYKESPLGWIPQDWSVDTLGGISNVVRGSTPRPAKDPRYFDGQFVPWITVGELSKDDWPYLSSTATCLTKEGAQHSRFLESGTVVISNSGYGCGVPKILSLSGCANDGVAAFLSLRDDYVPLFLYFYLYTQTLNLRLRVARGNDQPNLNTDMLKTFPVPRPLVEEQNAIAARMFAAVERIRAESRNIEKYRTVKNGLMHDLLTGRVRVPIPNHKKHETGVVARV